MDKQAKEQAASAPAMSKQANRHSLSHLQAERGKLQRHFIRCGAKILIIFEGRDAAGKSSAITRIIRHLSPRETRVAALGKPSGREHGSRYFQRYGPYRPAAHNRSWYNRAGVERVMGFCSEAEYEEFMDSVLEFENKLARSGIKLLKYHLDIGKAEQKRRLNESKIEPLTQWNNSAPDDQALKKWKQYSLARPHNPATPWTVVRADDKQLARLNTIKGLLSRLHYADKDEQLLLPDPQIVLAYDAAYLEDGVLAP